MFLELKPFGKAAAICSQKWGLYTRGGGGGYTTHQALLTVTLVYVEVQLPFCLLKDTMYKPTHDLLAMYKHAPSTSFKKKALLLEEILRRHGHGHPVGDCK